jgi:hypothetical protein
MRQSSSKGGKIEKIELIILLVLGNNKFEMFQIQIKMTPIYDKKYKKFSSFSHLFLILLFSFSTKKVLPHHGKSVTHKIFFVLVSNIRY